MAKSEFMRRLRDPDVWIPLAIFAGALLFRLVGIGWGLANHLHHQSYHPDELPIWLASQQIEPAKLKFTPGFYNYGTLYLTLLRVLSDLGATYGGIQNDPTGAWAYVSLCHLLGRVLTAVAGSAMAAALYPIVRRWSSRFGAVSAALLIAVAPGHVVHSRFQTVDILAAAFLTFSFLYALKLIPRPDGEAEAPGKAPMLSGLFAGLSAGVKYTGILGILTLWAALALARPQGWVKEAVKGTLVCLGAFLVTTPGVVLDSAAFIRDFRFEMVHTKTGHGIEFDATSSGFAYHFANLAVGIGLTMAALGIVALLFAAVKSRKWALALLAFGIPYYYVIGSSQVKFLRYTFPLYPAIACGFGWAMGVANRRRGLYSTVIVFGILGLGGIDNGGLNGAAKYSLTMAEPDARDLAGEYLKTSANSASDTVGLVSDPWFWTPALYPDTGLPRAVGRAKIFETMAKASGPSVVRYFEPDKPNEAYDWDTRLLDQLRPTFVVFSNYETIDLERIKKAGPSTDEEKLLVGRYDTFAADLKRDYSLVKVFGNQGPKVPDMMYIEPEILVWKRNDRR